MTTRHSESTVRFSCAASALNVTLNLAMDYDFVIQTPLVIQLDKARGGKPNLVAFDYVREKTLTCYNRIGEWLRTCPACHLRQHGLDVYLSQKRERANFFAPKRNQTGSWGISPSHNPPQNIVSKNSLSCLPTTSFTMRRKMQIPARPHLSSADCCWVDF